jgi:hypothetical protein
VAISQILKHGKGQTTVKYATHEHTLGALVIYFQNSPKPMIKLNFHPMGDEIFDHARQENSGYFIGTAVQKI